jgi:GH15 family glucan-1,4-alpha-glucosidase
MCALLNAGLGHEAAAWRDWLLRALGAEPGKLRIVYRVDGSSELDEHVVDWLEGYGGARPVRIGNAAVWQRQLDVYGEVIDAMSVATRGGIASHEHARHVERELVDHIEASWRSPGQGLWERRGELQHHVYSKVMAWVGIDRHLRGADAGKLSGAARTRLQALRAQMHREICDRGYSVSQGTFVQHYGSDELDASLLLLPALGFLPATDPRMERTIDAIESRLSIDGLVMRYATPPGVQPEGAFLACTLWLADCRIMQGRPAEARAALERVLALSNDLGLLSEEYDPRHKRLAGNFPQALTHLAVINTALGLCGPVLQRAGG